MTTMPFTMLEIPFGEIDGSCARSAENYEKCNLTTQIICECDKKIVPLQSQTIANIKEHTNISAMTRILMIDTVGRAYQTENTENGEFSYVKALNRSITGSKFLDIRFYDKESKTAVLIETKQRYKESDKKQLFDYVALERELNPKANIVAILANTENDRLSAWRVPSGKEAEILNDTKLKTMEEYIGYFKEKKSNDSTAILTNTSTLNELLRENDIKEDVRSQFVGTCLLALKYNFQYENMSNYQIRAGIKETLERIMRERHIEHRDKIDILCNKVLDDESVAKLPSDQFCKILRFIHTNIFAYINDESFEGQDLLSYFFTTFNKYVSREDKNQAFTPNHIAHFMCKIGGITKSTRVLDPTCGSGTFLVQAMSQILRECDTISESDTVKKCQIYGIEAAEKVFGLATTNMLIHGDGNTNIVKDSCFERQQWIKDANINLVLMNPPYNAVKSNVQSQYKDPLKSTEDPSKGLCFVKYVADTVNHGRLLALLPMQCAIATKTIIADMKDDLLKHHTLDAVFSFPAEMFYPGASAVACCLVLNLGQPHPKNYETFFGYYKEDGFEKRKGVGRIDVKDKWNSIEQEWLSLYQHRLQKPGMSVLKHISSGDEEWCAEAYMETDYSALTEIFFVKKMREYMAYKVSISNPYKRLSFNTQTINNSPINLCTKEWKEFKLGDYFEKPYKATAYNAIDLFEADELDPTAIAYVTRTDINNGVKCFLLRDDSMHTERGNAITLGDTTATIFYQENDFVCGDHIVVCRSKYLNKYIGMFITALLSKERYRYSYGRAFLKDALADTILHLPALVNPDGTYSPDWQFMEDYIKSLPYSKNI